MIEAIDRRAVSGLCTGKDMSWYPVIRQLKTVAYRTDVCMVSMITFLGTPDFNVENLYNYVLILTNNCLTSIKTFCLSFLYILRHWQFGCAIEAINRPRTLIMSFNHH